MLFHIAAGEHQKGLGHFVIRVSVFWCEISHWICTLSFCLLTSSGLFLCVCLRSVLAAGTAAHWHSPTHSREWLLIRMWVLPTHDPIWGRRHCQAAPPSSSTLSAVCYCADRGKWQFSSFPAKWFSADSASFNSTAMQWRKRREKEKKKTKNRRAHAYQPFRSIVMGGHFVFLHSEKSLLPSPRAYGRTGEKPLVCFFTYFHFGGSFLERTHCF